MSASVAAEYANAAAFLANTIQKRRHLLEVGYEFPSPERWEEKLHEAIAVLEYFKEQAEGRR